MKTRQSNRLRGFTLVELLVVIAIIAVLAAAGFAAGNAAIKRAKKVTCLAAATAVESGVTQFYNEYGRLPNVGETCTTNSGSGVELVSILLGKEATSTTMQNSKQINYLASMKEGKSKKNGLIYASGGSSIEGLFDPWGNGYEVSLDQNYDEEITDPIESGKTLRGRRVAVWSKGPKQKKPDIDNVKTW
jgi:prepilin-type N-terminal cleavage/methylation domain-containing protein